jgi:hypothetical protein
LVGLRRPIGIRSSVIGTRDILLTPFWSQDPIAAPPAPAGARVTAPPPAAAAASASIAAIDAISSAWGIARNWPRFLL